MDHQEPQFEVFFDGKCSLCAKEIAMLRKWDTNDRIIFTDFTQPGFDFEEVGISYTNLMKQIHGRIRPDGWLTGVDVFRELYTRVGWNKAVWVSKIPGLSNLLSLAYRLFAKLRLWLHRKRYQADACSSGSCNSFSPEGMK